MKASLLIIALLLVAGLVALGLRPDEPVASDASQGPSFEVIVVKPLRARPLFGLLPGGFFGLPPDELRFDHLSRGAKVANVGHDRLEVSADGWEFLLATDGEGELAPGTRLLFPVELAGRQLSLLCRPADRASGYLRTTTSAASERLDGHFLVKLANCANVRSGKTIEWPPAPLAVRGSFEGLPVGRP